MRNKFVISTIALLGILISQNAISQQATPPTENMMAPSDPAIVAASTAAAEQGGSGQYKASMFMDSSLPTHTLYHPIDMSAANSNKLPIVVWGNGACVNYGNRFRYFLTEIASHGYFVIAIGPIGPQYLEGNASQNAPGWVAPPRTGPDLTRPPASQYTQLIDAIDWANAANANSNSPFFGKLDTSKIAVMGQSCGGLQAIAASQDVRVTTSVVWNSGTFPEGALPLAGTSATKQSLPRLHAPVAYISGDERDIAFKNADADYEAINHIPIFRAYEKGIGHIGTYRSPNGGDFGQVGVKWLDWQLKGDNEARTWFVGANCKLCTNPNWVVRKKRID